MTAIGKKILLLSSVSIPAQKHSNRQILGRGKKQEKKIDDRSQLCVFFFRSFFETIKRTSTKSIEYCCFALFSSSLFSILEQKIAFYFLLCFVQRKQWEYDTAWRENKSMDILMFFCLVPYLCSEQKNIEKVIRSSSLSPLSLSPTKKNKKRGTSLPNHRHTDTVLPSSPYAIDKIYLSILLSSNLPTDPRRTSPFR